MPPRSIPVPETQRNPFFPVDSPPSRNSLGQNGPGRGGLARLNRGKLETILNRFIPADGRSFQYAAWGVVLLVLVPVVILFRIPAGRFYRAVRQPFLIAFSTASSEAALPLALENMEEFGVPKHIVGFVIPTGYSFNLDGTTLYLAMASIFVAQGAGVHLSLSQQVVIMLTLMLTSKGVAGVPRAAIVILTGTLATFHLPMEGIAVLLGVDALLDMARTSINVLGNCLASAVVARWEGYGLEAR